MILHVEHVAKAFGKKKVLRNVSFDLEPGNLYGIVGENGSGKSSLLKIIVGEWQADKGKVTINGRLGYCPQKELLFSELTVDEHFNYFASAYEIPKLELAERSDFLMEKFQFKKYRKEMVANLSGGTQQKLNLSIALLHQPNLLILDEPYNGFDWDTYLRFWNYAEFLQRRGCAILVVTHLLNDKKPFNRIFHLENGCLK